MLCRLVLSLGLLAGAGLTVSDAKADRRVALVIGNSEYAHAMPLRNPRNDATDIAESLRQVGFQVLLGLDLDQEKFASTVEHFARLLDDADVGLFFYAGHGLQINEKNHLVSVNAKLASEFMISAETIELDAIIKLMESKSSTNLVFLDACRNNPLTENLRRNLAAMKRSSSLGRGLARVEPTGRDTLVAFAAAPGQEATDGADRNSPFTAALLKHIPAPGVEVSVMLKQVAADVRRDTQNAQRPQQLSDMTRTFYFTVAALDPSAKPAQTGAAEAAAGATANANDRSLEVAYWNAAQADCDSVRAYLQRFPNGAFVELARLAERRQCASGRRVAVVDGGKAGGAQPAGPKASLPGAAPAADGAADAQAEQGTAVAALPDASAARPAGPSRAAVALTGEELARVIQLELMRVGCGNVRADGNWTSSTRDAVRSFNKHAGTKLTAEEPTRALLATLRDLDERVCPPQCEAGSKARGNTCVAEPREQARGRRAEKRRGSRSAGTRQYQGGGGQVDIGSTINAIIRHHGFRF